jgi:hypothetical protein
MEETIGGAIVESAVLNVLAENPDTLYVSAAKEICTAMMVKVLRGVFVGLVVFLQHDPPKTPSRCRAFDASVKRGWFARLNRGVGEWSA